MTQVDGGGTATNTYDAENQRVRIDDPGNPSTEYIFNPFGQRASVWDATDGWQSQGQTYWGAMPVEFYNNGYAHFQHQDWLGTEQMRTNNTAQVEGSYTSLPFGDGFTVNGADDDTYHFAGTDYDYNSGYSGTAHAQFRQYDNGWGNWMSPDMFSGSYDLSNPQTYNRYSYALNNPASMTDPSGLNGDFPIGGNPVLGCAGAALSEGGNVVADLGCLGTLLSDIFSDLFGGGSSFHGTLNPRPNAQPWDEYHIHYGPNIAAALGIPDAGCEFGACGPAAMGLTTGTGLDSCDSNQVTCIMSTATQYIPFAAMMLFAPNHPSIAPFQLPNYYRVTCFGNPTGTSFSKRGCTYACGGEEEWGPFENFPTGGIMYFKQSQLYAVCGGLSQTFCPRELSVEGNYTPSTGWDSNAYISKCRQ